MEVEIVKRIAKGAEADIYLVNWYGEKAILKVRVEKKYRDKELDREIREERTKREAKALYYVKKAGVLAPTIYDVDLVRYGILMEFINGELARNCIEKVYFENKRVIRDIGRNIGMMHESGIVHNDLTTSNMIFMGEKIFFIDFGLSTFSFRIEDQAIDLLVLIEALKATHREYYMVILKEIIRGYREVRGEKSNQVFRQIDKIKRRSRYGERQL